MRFPSAFFSFFWVWTYSAQLSRSNDVGRPEIVPPVGRLQTTQIADAGAVRGQVRHHAWVGTGQFRYFRIDLDILTVRSDQTHLPAFGDRLPTMVLVWRRGERPVS